MSPTAASYKVMSILGAALYMYSAAALHEAQFFSHTLTIYLVKPTDGFIDSSYEVTTGLLVDYSSVDEIVAMDIALASKRIAARLWDDDGSQIGKLQLQFTCDPAHSHVTITFGGSHLEAKLRATDDECVSVLEDEDGQLTGVVISQQGRSNAEPTGS
ncbi:hypothetical protein MMC07_006557 [Pseudocyphellaria aurata]|nr:hypothetical protein [Pseudocyphellaria aurata]